MPSHGGVQLMTIRTLDEEAENDNTLRKVGAQAEMGTWATENIYKMGDIINMETTTGITFGAATGIDVTVQNTAVTFDVATTNEKESTSTTMLEAVEEISEVAAINPNKTTGSEVISIILDICSVILKITIYTE